MVRFNPGCLVFPVDCMGFTSICFIFFYLQIEGWSEHEPQTLWACWHRIPCARASTYLDSSRLRKPGSPSATFPLGPTANSIPGNKIRLVCGKNLDPLNSGTGFAFSSGIAAIREARSWRWFMKFQKMIRIQLMLVGLGAGLLVAKPVFAQQETDPTLFEVASDPSQPDQGSFNVAPPPAAIAQAAPDSTVPSAVQEADAAGMTALDVKTILALMVGIGSIVLLGMAEAVRGSRRRTWKEKASDGFPAGVTAS
jgi:hypothetical protein